LPPELFEGVFRRVGSEVVCCELAAWERIRGEAEAWLRSVAGVEAVGRILWVLDVGGPYCY